MNRQNGRDLGDMLFRPVTCDCWIDRNGTPSRHTFVRQIAMNCRTVSENVKVFLLFLWLTSTLQCRSPLERTFVPMKLKTADWFTSWLEKPTLAYLLLLIIEVRNTLFRFLIFPIHLREPLAYAHPIILAIWVALSSVFVQYMKWWPKPQATWVEYLRILPAFASMGVAVMFLIDW